MESIGIVIYERLGHKTSVLLGWSPIKWKDKKNCDKIEIKDLPIKYDSPLSV